MRGDRAPTRSAAATLGLALGALLVGAAVLWHGLRPLSDTDLWWQIRLGELILQTRSLVPEDPFSHTFGGAPWPYKDAGAAIIFFGAWALGGTAAIVLLKAALLCTTAVAVWVLLRRVRAVPAVLALLGTALAIESIAFRFTERPASISLLLLVVALVVLERHRRGQGRLWPLVVLTIVGANLHRGVVVVPIVVGAFAVAAFVQRRIGPPPNVADVNPGHAGLVAVGCALACLCTPFGPALFGTTFTLMAEHTGLVTEWAPVTVELVRHLTPATFVLAAVVIAGVLVTIVSARPIDVWDLLLVAMAFVLGLAALRHLPYLALLGIGPAASGLSRLSGAWTGRLAPSIAAAGGATALAAALGNPLPGPSLGLAPHHFPERAVAFVTALPDHARLRGPVFNELGYGGWLIFHAWPEHRVYVDGRIDLVYPPEHVAHHVAALGDPAAFRSEVERWGIEWVLLDNAPHASARVHFDRDPAWVLVHASRRGLVYVRAAGPNAALARSDGYRLLWAHDLEGSLARAAAAGRGPEALAELRRMVHDDPDNLYAVIALARLTEAIGAR